MSTSQELVVVHMDGEPRIDSRLVAMSLGIEHESFMKTLNTYEQELQEVGLLRFEIGAVKQKGARGTKYVKYVMLNEDQAIFATTLSRNTRQVVEFKLKLTKAFSEARKREQSSLYGSTNVNMLWQQRLALFNERTHIPVGYWCIYNEIAAACWRIEFLGAHLREDAVPDISVGQHWCKYARSKGLDMSLIRKYPHHYPDKRGIVAANIYPDIWLPAFRRWFHGDYLKNEFPRYVQAHALALPPTTTRRLLG